MIVIMEENHFDFIVNHAAVHPELGPVLICKIQGNNLFFLSKDGEHEIDLYSAFNSGKLKMVEDAVQKKLTDCLVPENKSTVINAGKRSVYYVFQGKSYEHERRYGYMWAPANSGIHHWERMRQLRPGDIIFHGAGGEIRSISEVKNAFHSAIFPFNPSEGTGYKVDCNYYDLRYPITTKFYKEEIKKYSGFYTPFNKNGTGNQGYLFDLDIRLAKYFLDIIIRYNPDIKNLQFLDELINLR